MRPTRHGPALAGDHCSSPSRSCSRLNFFHVRGRRCSGSFPPWHPPSVPPRPRELSGTVPLPGSPRLAYLAGDALGRALAAFPQPGSPVPAPRCRLGLAPANPQGRGREQTRVGGAGAEAEGRAQREEAAEARSPGRPLRLSIPASGRRAGRGRRGPASGGEGPAGPGRV